MRIGCFCAIHILVWMGIATGISKGQTDGQAGLRPGDDVPQPVWESPLAVVNHREDTLRLGDHRGRLVILDFWATWCKPCVGSLNKLDVLQRQFGDSVAVIPITDEHVEKVTPFLARQGWSLPSVVGETRLRAHFPCRSLPHQVWLKDGKVLAVVGPEYATAQNITTVLNGGAVSFRHKLEVSFDKNKPLFMGGNGGDGSTMKYQSVISGRLDAQISGVNAPSGSIMAYNQTIEQLFQFALGDSIPTLYAAKYTVFDLADTVVDRLKPPQSLLEQLMEGEITPVMLDWMDRNQYCYNLVLPRDTPLGLRKRKMFLELQEYARMALHVNVDYREVAVRALVLEVAGDAAHIVSKGGQPLVQWQEDGTRLQLRNQPVGRLVDTYINMALKDHPLPVVDGTNLGQPIDIVLGNEDLKSLLRLNAALQEVSLRLVERDTLVKMVVYTEVMD